MSTPNLISPTELFNNFSKVTNLNISEYNIKSTNEGLVGSLKVLLPKGKGFFYWEIKEPLVYLNVLFEGEKYTDLYLCVNMNLKEWETLFKKSLTTYLPCT